MHEAEIWRMQSEHRETRRRLNEEIFEHKNDKKDL